MILICPECRFQGPIEEFDCSLSDECWCQKCNCEFQIEEESEDADE